VERNDDHFDLDDDFVAASDEETDYDRMMERTDRRVRAAAPVAKKGKAAWSKLEDVLAEKRLQKALQDFDQDFEEDA
jgi:hypothetical protein